MGDRFAELADAVINGRREDAGRLTRELLQEGASAGDVLEKALISAMSTVGEQFKNCEIYLPEMLMAARAMKAAMEILRPHLVKAGVQPAGTMIIGTVQGDLHDIGKNLVAMMAEGAGFHVVDLGVDVSPEKFAAAAREHKPQLVGMSALLTTTMSRMQDVIRTLEQESLRANVKVIVGGAATTEDWAAEIGADAYAPDAATAAEKCKELVGKLNAAA